MEREKLSSRLGFLLVSAGCAIGLGNVWRFPYITGQYGGAVFVIIYLVFLVMLGLPIMIMEFSIGRAGKRDIAGSYRNLEKPGQKWHNVGYIHMLGCLILLMFYTTVAGWCMYYFYSTVTGSLTGISPKEVNSFFGGVLGNAGLVVFWMGATVVLGSIVCLGGLKNGVEKTTKIMMAMLFIVLLVLVVRAVTLPGASEGLKFYLVPNFEAMTANGIKGIIDIAYAALGQAFFTLSLGIGAMTIFGSYIDKTYSLTGESIIVVILDTLIAFLAGLVIFPTTFAFDVNPGQGPGLVFVTLPNIFNSMGWGRFWGSLFFLFLSMASLTTIIAVMENLIAFTMSEFKLTRKKSTLIIGVGLFFLSLPTALGFNVLSHIQPLGEGTTFLDLFDFIVSNNMLPLGGIVILIFCTRKFGWGWGNFIKEVDSGNGIKFPKAIKFYVSYILPFIILGIFVIDYINKFFI